MGKRDIDKEIEQLQTRDKKTILQYLVDVYGSNVSRILYSDRHSFTKDLLQWIFEKTKLLESDFYTLPTRIFWILNDITSFEDPHTRCHRCGKKYEFVNVGMVRGYHTFCSRRCSASSEESKRKVKATKLRRYGDENYCNVEKIRQVYLTKTDEEKQRIKEKRKSTLLATTGYEYTLQNSKSKAKLRDTWKSKSLEEIHKITEKTKNTNLKRYGVVSSMCLQSFKDNTRKVKLERYGDEFFNNREKSRRTTIEHYGKINAPQTIKKIQATKSKNKTFNSSKPEKEAFHLLHFIFPHLQEQYYSEAYPFNADFYDPDQPDVRFEFQGTWTHGKHPFDESNEEDIKVLAKWISRGTKFYWNAVVNWVWRDWKKREAAKKNHIKLIEFWNLDEVREFVIHYFDRE